VANMIDCHLIAWKSLQPAIDYAGFWPGLMAGRALCHQGYSAAMLAAGHQGQYLADRSHSRRSSCSSCRFNGKTWERFGECRREIEFMFVILAFVRSTRAGISRSPMCNCTAEVRI